MKKLFLLILFTAVLVFNQSCSEDSNPVNVDDPALVGTWELNELKIDNEVIDRETFDDDYPQKISFNDDGSFTMIIFKSDKFKRTIVGEYESKNNSITFKVPSESADLEIGMITV